jgi:hypothetical protein
VADADDVVPVAGDSGADPDDVVPIAGDSTGEVPPTAGADRPFVSNAPWDSSGYEGLSAATDELFPTWPAGPPPPDLDVADAYDVNDVVPIAGDSHAPGDDDAMFGSDGGYVGPPPEPPPAATPPAPPADSTVDTEVDDAIDDVLDRFGAPQDEGLLPTPRPRWRNPWLVAALIAVLVLLVAAITGALVSRGSSSHTSDAAAATTTTAASSASPSSSASASIPTSDVTLSLGLGQVSGTDLPLLISVQAASAAPHRLTVRVAMTGPGVPASDTFAVGPGATVTHTVVGHGCGSWTVKVVSIDGQPVAAGGNPNLQNGATHNC